MDVVNRARVEIQGVRDEGNVNTLWALEWIGPNSSFLQLFELTGRLMILIFDIDRCTIPRLDPGL